MNEYKLGKALGGVSDELLLEAAEVKKKKNRQVSAGRILWKAAAVAAVLALIVSVLGLWPAKVDPETGEIIAVPGVMKVYACEVEGATEALLQEYLITEENFNWRAVWGFSNSSSFGRPVSFCIPEDYYQDKEISIHISSDEEAFCKEMTLANGTALYLDDFVDPFVMIELREKYPDQDIYMDIVVYADNVAVGYGVMTFYMDYDSITCYAYKCMTVCYPLIDGQFQEVSEDYIETCIEEYKQTQPEGQGAIFFDNLHEQER